MTASGVKVKVVTGDNELVTQHLCAELGLPVTGVLTGSEIQEMTDPALAARAEAVNLFCRVTPPQKNRVIQALRSRRHVVGYLGDGINDAPVHPLGGCRHLGGRRGRRREGSGRPDPARP